jgi:hypothetical protein
MGDLTKGAMNCFCPKMETYKTTLRGCIYNIYIYIYVYDYISIYLFIEIVWTWWETTDNMQWAYPETGEGPMCFVIGLSTWVWLKIGYRMVLGVLKFDDFE